MPHHEVFANTALFFKADRHKFCTEDVTSKSGGK